MDDVALTRGALIEAVARLSIEHRAVIHRSYYEAQTVAQIANDLHLDTKTVTSMLHYGVRELLHSLEERGVRPSWTPPAEPQSPLNPSSTAAEAPDCDSDSLQDQQ
jgi:hypothetical protein